MAKNRTLNLCDFILHVYWTPWPIKQPETERQNSVTSLLGYYVPRPVTEQTVACARDCLCISVSQSNLDLNGQAKPEVSLRTCKQFLSFTDNGLVGLIW